MNDKKSGGPPVESDPLKLKFKDLTLEFDGNIDPGGGGDTGVGKSSPVCPRALYAGWVEVEDGKVKGRLHNIAHVLGEGLEHLLHRRPKE